VLVTRKVQCYSLGEFELFGNTSCGSLFYFGTPQSVPPVVDLRYRPGHSHTSIRIGPRLYRSPSSMEKIVPKMTYNVSAVVSDTVFAVCIHVMHKAPL